jgi:hypothetical protein
LLDQGTSAIELEKRSANPSSTSHTLEGTSLAITTRR